MKKQKPKTKTHKLIPHTSLNISLFFHTFCFIPLCQLRCIEPRTERNWMEVAMLSLKLHFSGSDERGYMFSYVEVPPQFHSIPIGYGQQLSKTKRQKNRILCVAPKFSSFGFVHSVFSLSFFSCGRYCLLSWFACVCLNIVFIRFARFWLDCKTHQLGQTRQCVIHRW